MEHGERVRERPVRSPIRSRDGEHPAGARTAYLTVLIVGDRRREATGTLRVVLHNPTAATLAHGSGTGRITNDDRPSSLEPLTIAPWWV